MHRLPDTTHLVTDPEYVFTAIGQVFDTASVQEVKRVAYNFKVQMNSRVLSGLSGFLIYRLGFLLDCMLF